MFTGEQSTAQRGMSQHDTLKWGPHSTAQVHSTAQHSTAQHSTAHMAQASLGRHAPVLSLLQTLLMMHPSVHSDANLLPGECIAACLSL